MTSTRITITLNLDIAELLEDLTRRRGISFETALNDAIRKGLASERGSNTPYRVPSRPMGLRPNIDLTHALGLADSIEDEEILQKPDVHPAALAAE